MWWGDAENAKRDFDGLFSNDELSVGAVFGSPTGEEYHCLGVSEIKLGETHLHDLMRSVAVPNNVSPMVFKALGVTLEGSNRSVTVAKRWRAGVLSEVQ